MRDIQRIDLVLQRLEEVWKKNPDLRLGQLIQNVYRESTIQYYLEDEEFISNIEGYYDFSSDEI